MSKNFYFTVPLLVVSILIITSHSYSDDKSGNKTGLCFGFNGLNLTGSSIGLKYNLTKNYAIRGDFSFDYTKTISDGGESRTDYISKNQTLESGLAFERYFALNNMLSPVLGAMVNYVLPKVTTEPSVAVDYLRQKTEIEVSAFEYRLYFGIEFKLHQYVSLAGYQFIQYATATQIEKYTRSNETVNYKDRQYDFSTGASKLILIIYFK